MNEEPSEPDLPTLENIHAMWERCSNDDTLVELTIKPNRDYEMFGRLMWGEIRNTGSDFIGDEWSETVLPLAEEAGLCRRVAYDPEIHGYVDCADEGDEIWWWD